MVQIITDSSTLFTVEEGKEMGIEVLPLCVSIGELEGRDTQIDMDAFYGEIEKGNNPTSSQPPIGEVMEAFEKYPEAEIINISMADGLSGTYQTACGAKASVDNSENITVINSKTLCGPHRYMVQKAVQMKKEGKTAKEIIAWLEYARENAHYCASWVVSYNYRFPEASEFARLGMKTTGSVFANLQNKHSAPGICTLSGDSLFKLWKWTKDPLYLELLRDIACTIGQYMSTGERPIYDWGLTREAMESGDSALLEAHRLPSGFINERVNMSDWEGDGCIGGVFNGSCWSETSNLLALAEVMPLLEDIL